ncbi:MAG: hypothetical protein ACE5F9_06685 [Phycisphaerae bacterium]
MPSLPDIRVDRTAARPTRPRDRPVGFDLRCPGCGYNLRGLIERRCPECGRAFTIRRALIEQYGALDLAFWSMYRRALLAPSTFWSRDGARLGQRLPWIFAMQCSLLSAVIGASVAVLLLVPVTGWGWSAVLTMWGVFFVFAAAVAVGMTELAAVAAVAAGAALLLFGRSNRMAYSRAAAALWLPAWMIYLAVWFVDQFGVLFFYRLASSNQMRSYAMLTAGCALTLLTLCYGVLASARASHTENYD